MNREWEKLNFYLKVISTAWAIYIHTNLSYVGEKKNPQIALLTKKTEESLKLI